MSEGVATCPICHGRGGMRSPAGWHRCECTRPTREQKQLQRRMNSLGAKYPKGDALKQALGQLALDEVAADEPDTAVLDIIERAMTNARVTVVDRKPRGMLVRTKRGNYMIGIQKCL